MRRYAVPWLLWWFGYGVLLSARGDDIAQEEAREEGTCDASTTQDCKPHPDLIDANDADNDNKDDDLHKYGTTASTIVHCLETEQVDESSSRRQQQQRPKYNATTFAQLRNIYRRVQSQFPLEMSPIASEDHAPQAGIVAPFAVQTIEGMRGVFATHNIYKGQRVWSPLYLGAFFTEDAWLAFLTALGDAFDNDDDDSEIRLGKSLVCDALQWSYVMEMPVPRTSKENGDDDNDDDNDPQWTYAAVLDLDEGSFVNHGWWDKGEANIMDSLPPEWHQEHSDAEEEEEICESCMYAVRDIAAGDQILCDYTHFYEFGVLEWYEASVAKAWDVDRNARPPDEPQWHYR